ncbi:MAG: STAS domain-containing protein [Chloroflexia bacterium]|nr:STAS domain-containing protein [Chloroflexia bacterium]
MATAYLLFFPIVVLVALAVYVLLQNPRGAANRLFALYMFSLTISTCAILVMSTTPSMALASISAATIVITVFCLNGSLLSAIVLALYFRRHLLRWYGLPLLLALGLAFSAVVVTDICTEQCYFVALPGGMLGQGYIPTDVYMAGPQSAMLMAWFFGGIALAIGLLVAAWFRAPRGERAPIGWLLISLLVSGGLNPLLPAHPLTPTLNPLFFSAVFAVVAARYRIFLPAEVTLSAVFESANEGMLICDRRGLVQQANRAFEKLSGTDADTVLDQSPTTLLAPLWEQAGQDMDKLEAWLAQGKSGESYSQLLHLQQRVLVVSAGPIQDQRGHRVGSLLTLRDVTEQERVRQALEEQARLAETVQELSAPLVPVMEGVLILPLVGGIDSERARSITNEILQAVARERARVLLIDVTGIPVVDTMVANLLVQAVRAVRLLGCETILVGIRAEVARTMVQLGLEMEGLQTRRSLQDGLAYARKRLQGES